MIYTTCDLAPHCRITVDVDPLFKSALNLNMNARPLALLARRIASRTTASPRYHQQHPTFSRAFCAVGPKPAKSEGIQAVEQPENDDDEKKPGAIGGFMRGLIGGHQVAEEDAFVAAAKEQGVEIPPPPPPRSDLVALKRRRRREDEEEEQEETIRDRLFSRFSGSAFMRGASEARERISERIEESDNPVVNFFRNMFAENEMGQVIREIQMDDKTFRVSEFVQHVEHELVPTIMSAYLKGDRDTLKELVTEEAYAMLNASILERETTGVTMDPNILAVNDVELFSAKLLEDAPVLIVSFSLQQINCIKNRAGDVVEGAEDDIRAYYYLMAFVREFEVEEEKPTGGAIGEDQAEAEEAESETKHSEGPPPWKLMEMVIRGAHSTI